MPNPGSWLSLEREALVQQVADALREDRRSVAAFLEERHTVMIEHLATRFCKESFDAEAAALYGDPDSGRIGSMSLEPSTATTQVDAVADRKTKASSESARSSSDDAAFAVDPTTTAAEIRSTSRKFTAEYSSEYRFKTKRNSDGIFEVSKPGNSEMKRLLPTMTVMRMSSYNNSAEPMTRELVIRRLQAKLGTAFRPGKALSADALHASLESLSLASYDLETIRSLVSNLSSIFGRESLIASAGSSSRALGVAVNETIGLSLQNFQSHSSHESPDCHMISCNLLVEVMLLDAAELKKHVPAQLDVQLAFLKGILLASDANCLVAELMCLHVDDLALPPPKPTLLDYLEPLICIAILINAVLVGLSTDPSIAEHPAMVTAEICFTLVFILELVVKLTHAGVWVHFRGSDGHWNLFDLLLVVLAVADLLMTIIVDFEVGRAVTISRLARLTRLARLIRIFRIPWLSELHLVCKGLVGGLRTLFWAVVLLMFVLYVIAVLLTVLVGEDGYQPGLEFEAMRMEHFSTLGRSAITAFRCLLIVECTDKQGMPILVWMRRRYGWIVPICYFFFFVTVSIGLVNLIMAIYIDHILREAKSSEQKDKAARYRESLRVASQLKRLLIRFCTLQHAVETRGTFHAAQVLDQLMKQTDDESGIIAESIDAHQEITKDVFMLGIQQPDIQHIMNDLDLPPERAHLFDVLDADGTGVLHPTELLDGLLKVRGEARRSDAAAPLLAVRSLQGKVDILDRLLADRHVQMMTALNALMSSFQRTSVASQ